ncbi:hypothetical protein CO731_05621 (plasmid) [Aminobacter sp. MSH1]|uniref:hypothetical protein n=1 Tax=Aminobacter sp. MSH1 TaxID=374606 RepID=UPI000D5050ED|nr:hypothetical protein [Aminobacter sp. MSH1]AWC26100.1 hypothetical protein CO731_05621 [Aminobacter sp. MSH1]
MRVDAVHFGRGEKRGDGCPGAAAPVPDIGAGPDRGAINHDLDHPERCPRSHLRRSFIIVPLDLTALEGIGSPAEQLRRLDADLARQG